MTASQKVLPTFIVIGAAKAGTTSLWRYLKAHPDVFMCSPKEPEFFTGGSRWRLGIEWYASLFERGANAKARGEASVTYSYFPLHKWVPGRMHRIIPEARLVYIIRNPIDRMISMYRLRRDLKLESRPIDEALLDRVYIEPSRYALQIERYLEHYDRPQLLVITSEELASQRRATLRSMFEFIGVDPDFFPPSAAREFNRAAEHRQRYRPAGRLRNTKLHWFVRRIVPSDSRVSQLAWRLMSRASSIPPESALPSDATRRRALEVLQPDLARLPAYVGDSFHCWGLLETSERSPDIVG